MKYTQTLNLVLFSILSTSTFCQNKVVDIWPGLAPGSENIEDKEEWRNGKSVINVYQPELTVFLPKNADQSTPSVLVIPGGGYRQVVMQKEGYKIAKWLNDNNIAAFVLKYRLDKSDALRDGQRAMSYLRSKSTEFNIDPNKIGAIGFSAGAHLACNLTMHHDMKTKTDNIDDLSSLPDFWIGIYGRYDALLDNIPEDESPKNNTPVMLVHAGNDTKVPVSSSLKMYAYLKEHGIPAELHVYDAGEHGFALETNRGAAITSTVTDWSRRCIDWLTLRGIL